ncbi:ABC transporter permease [Maledivibacter halophilus]|uniref:Peptide/nickel transport system permease protein n=1 Tax=Maledivibacter halophilus TaxID=36842 RepID=A0A1T5ICZ2_9FIRM|nr:ABC transporter permease [Maledivibacter halophilus]SKC36965.1 peptide/nickel transport system permease protein [Maledivibacter halophilus]
MDSAYIQNIEEIKKKYKKRSQTREVWRRLKKNKMAILGIIILSIFILTAIFADYIADYKTEAIRMNARERLQEPSKEHWFGTDDLGRDIFARIVHGTRISLFVGTISVGIALSIGGTLGAISGYYGGKFDNIIMRTLDIILAVPSILLAITIVSSLGANIVNVMIAVGISNIPGFARVVRAAVLGVKDQEYIEAARAIGAKNHVIILKHVLPNCLAPIIVYSTLKVATAIMAAAGLSFIGLGVKPPTPEWGSMLSGGRAFIRDKMYIVLFPGLAIIATILSLNLLGDGLRDALDPRLK